MFDGVWRSQAGAELRLLQMGEAVSGTYTAADPGYAQTHRSRILVGTAEGDIIGFVTSTSSRQEITAWTGRLVRTDEKTAEAIHAVFHAVERSSQPKAVADHVALETTIFSKVENACS
ncbi:avidin/streptavidin family protein [Methylobacterium sp. A52T]